MPWYCSNAPSGAKVVAVVKNLADFDLDEQALVKKKRPWGWFVAGLIFLGSVTFALAYALPLNSSHTTLTAEHEKLAGKAADLDRAFVSTKKQLEETEKARRDLEKKVTDVQDARKELASRLQMSATTAQRALVSLEKAKLAELTASPEAILLTIKNRALFLPRSAKLNPSMGKVLCKALGDAAGDKSWLTRVVIHFPEGEKDGWKDVGEKAGALGDLLSSRCQIPGDRLVLGAQPTSRADANDQTTFEIGPTVLPRLAASE